MTEETTNIVLEHLRRIRASVERMEEQLLDVKLRLSALEQTVGQGFGSNQSMIGQIQVSMGSLHRRSDRIDVRTDSFETRLDRLEGEKSEVSRRLARIEQQLNLTGA